MLDELYGNAKDLPMELNKNKSVVDYIDTSEEEGSLIANSEEDLNKFIDECKPEQLQKMFDIMILQWTWRDRLLTAWGIK